MSRLTDLTKNERIRLIDLTPAQIAHCAATHTVRNLSILELHLPDQRRYYKAWFCAECNRLVFARRHYPRPAAPPPGGPAVA